LSNFDFNKHIKKNRFKSQNGDLSSLPNTSGLSIGVMGAVGIFIIITILTLFTYANGGGGNARKIGHKKCKKTKVRNPSDFLATPFAPSKEFAQNPKAPWPPSPWIPSYCVSMTLLSKSLFGKQKSFCLFGNVKFVAVDRALDNSL
jgi:hypothetical protein